MNLFLKLKKILGNKFYNTLVISFFLFLISILEIISIGLFIPLFGFLLDDNKLSFFNGITFLPFNFFNYFASFTQQNQILITLFLIFTFISLKNFSSYLIVNYINNYLVNLFRHLSTSFLKSYTNLPYTFFLKTNSSKIIQNINVDTANFVFVLIKSSLILISDIFLIIGFSIILAYVSFEIFLITIITLFIFIFIFFTIQNKKIKDTSLRVHILEVSRINLIQQIFRSIRDFKLSSFQKEFLDHFDSVALNLSNLNRKYLNYLAIPKFILETFVVLIFVFIFLSLSFYFKKSNSEIITIIGIYALCFFRLMPVVSSILRNAQELRFFSESVNQLLIIKKEIKNNLDNNQINYIIKSPLKKNKSFNFRKINFDNVKFSYQDKNIIFNNLNFELKAGEKIGILGRTGSGKTTFVDLLVGLLNPQSGSVKFDKFDIKYHFERIKGIIGYVTQNVLLTDTTILSNIAFGVKQNKIDLKKINNLIEALDLSDFVNSQEKKLYTIVGEGGTKLSGGQRQRLGIARALYHNPKLVIFDEATSALDIKTEEIIMKNLKNSFFKNITLVLISHRPKTLRYCDKLFTLKNFKLIKHF
jgi:ABC-type multidrug transport system fused ATPase/permease subunit